jgi:hypothetical protein
MIANLVHNLQLFEVEIIICTHMALLPIVTNLMYVYFDESILKVSDDVKYHSGLLNSLTLSNV